MLRRICMVGLMLAGMMVSLAVAQTAATIEGVPARVQAGEYMDLNFWRTIKLGTAPFVNPGLTKTSSIAYSYEPKVLDEKTKAMIEVLATQGTIAAGQKIGKHIIVLIAQKALEQVINKPNTVWVSSTPTKGLGDGQSIVTWDSQGSVVIEK